MSKPLAAAVLLLSALAALLVAPAGTADAASGPISSVKIVGELTVAVGVTLDLTAQGRMKPEPGESAWLEFVWDFGDGSAVEKSGILLAFSTPYFEDKTTHAYAKSGLYTVRLLAGHGPFKDGRYKFERTTTLKVTVACPDYAPGPKSCPSAKYTPFTGKWSYADATGTGELTLTEIAGVVTGTADYWPTRGFIEHWKVAGFATLGKLASGEPSIEADLKMTPASAVLAPKSGKRPKGPRIVLALPRGADNGLAYRRGSTVSIDADDVEHIGLLTLVSRPDGEPDPEICSLVKAGRKKTVPGGLVAFVVSVRNQGTACLPAARLSLNVTVEGGVILPNTVAPQRVVTTGVTETALTFGLASLGAGKKGDGLAGLSFVVQADEDASEVEVRVNLGDLGGDDVVGVELPPDRVLCIPVERK